MSVGTFSVAAMAVPPPLNFGLAAGRQLVVRVREEPLKYTPQLTKREESISKESTTHSIQSAAYHFVSVYIGTRIRL